MMNKETFWKIINKNKNNPEEFWNKSENLSLEELFEFWDILSEYSNELDSSHTDFMMDMCIKYDIVNGSKTKLKDGSISYTFGSRFDWLSVSLVYRGKELYDAFVNEDEQQVKALLDNIKDEVSDEELDYMIVDIGRIKVCPEEDYEKMYEDEKLYEKYTDMFYNKYKEYSNRKN